MKTTRAILVLGLGLSGAAMWACSSDGTSDPQAVADTGTTDASADTAASDSTLPEVGADAGSDSTIDPVIPVEGGVVLRESGNTYLFTEGAEAVRTANGWAVGAASTQGGSLRGFRMVLSRMAVNDAGGVYNANLDLIPGKYHCGMDVITPPQFATMQYAVPGPTTAYQAGTLCEVVLTAFGAVGQPVTGTFTGNAKALVGDASVDLSGSFQVRRTD